MNNATIYFLLVKIIVLSSGTSLAQDFKLDKPDTTGWYKGMVTLVDGTTIKGSLKLNTRTGLLAYENGATSRSLTPKKVLQFEFLDEIQNKKRIFISVNYKDPKTPQFFEILMEFKTFALLSSFEKLKFKTNSNTTSVGGGYNPVTNKVQQGHPGATTKTTEYSQTETLFIFDPDGEITPLLDITNKEKDFDYIVDFHQAKTKTKKHDNKIIEQHTAPHFEALEDFAKENKLSFKKKDDLIKILEHYREIESN